MEFSIEHCVWWLTCLLREQIENRVSKIQNKQSYKRDFKSLMMNQCSMMTWDKQHHHWWHEHDVNVSAAWCSDAMMLW